MRAVVGCITGLFAALAMGQPARALDIEGTHRLDPQVVERALPQGQAAEAMNASQVLQSVYATGLFDDVRVHATADGSWHIQVVERPLVGSVEVSGASRQDDVKKTLAAQGVAPGLVYDPVALQHSVRALTRAYHERGYDAARVDTTTRKVSEHQIAIELTVEPGQATTVRQIRFEGRQAVPRRALLHALDIAPAGWWTWLTRRNRYTPVLAEQSAQALRDYYLDQGYLQVQVSPPQIVRRSDTSVDVVFAIEEGAVYRVSGWSLQSDHWVVPRAELAQQVSLQAGALCSQRALQATVSALAHRLDEAGYAFARVEPVPQRNDDDHTVHWVLQVDPGQRIYVRRVLFEGHRLTADPVLRNQVLQLEGSWASLEHIRHSKMRLDRTGFFSDVQVDMLPVAGEPDRMDVRYRVQERRSGNIAGGITYSQTEKLGFQFAISQPNFLGSGKKIDFELNNSLAYKIYSFGYADPFTSPGGVTRAFRLHHTRVDPKVLNTSRYAASTTGGAVSWGRPLSLDDVWRVGFGYDQTHLGLSSDPARVSDEVASFVAAHGQGYQVAFVETAWEHNTHNRAVFPTQGLRSRLSAKVALPGFDFSYIKVRWHAKGFHPFGRGWVGMWRGDLGYGTGYGRSKTLPFFNHFYAGGPHSVHGYEENTLGPQDSLGQPFGGNVHLDGSLAMIVPNPVSDSAAWRMACFVDGGSVFQDKVAWDALRYSVGVAVEWASPLGLLAFSWAQPLRVGQHDRVQRFQFSIGTS